MVNLCCICKLEAGIVADVSFHRIPKQEEIKLKWFISIGREVTKYSTVCSKHFEQDDFCYKEINHVMKRFLLPTAVPSLLLTHSNSDNESRKDIEKCCSQTILLENNIINRIHVKNNDCMESSKFESNNSQFSTNSTENTQKSTLKRKADEPNVIVKHFCNLRYIGDLRREDFTSDTSWKIVNNFVFESRAKQKILSQKVNRLHKKVKILQGLLNHLKQNRLLSNDACNAVVI